MAAEKAHKPPRGMQAFLIVWVGQFVSLMGTAMTNFAIPIYIFTETQRVQELALLGMAFMIPLIAMSPFAGAIVDRSNRKLMMMISDLAAGAMTILVLILFSTGRLEIWQLYITAAVSGAFQAFQWPAYSAAISVMLPKKQYGRANGLLSLAENGSTIAAPLLAGALLGLIGLRGILFIDIATFTFAVLTLLLVHIPQPPRTEEGTAGQGNLLREAWYGFQYILDRRSLLGLQLIFLAGNFLAGIAFVALPALILFRTDNNELALGTVQSIGGIGGVIGALVMSAWGGPKKLVHGVLLGWFLSSLFGTVLFGLGQSVAVWAIASFISLFFIPIINGSNQAIWQAKVAPDVQGRVFSARRMIAWITTPLAALIAIPLADSILGPALETGGVLSNTFLATLVGTGPGAGISLLFIITGLLAAMVGLSGYLFPAIRDAEELLPDHIATGGDIEAAADENLPAGIDGAETQPVPTT